MGEADDRSTDYPTRDAREQKVPSDSSSSQGRGLSIHVIGALVLIVAAVLTITALIAMRGVIVVNRETMKDDERYMACEEAIDQLQSASDLLTSQSRLYVTTGNQRYLTAYLDELYEDDNRGHALAILSDNIAKDSEALAGLTEALEQSNELAGTELYAMRLAADGYGVAVLPPRLEEVSEYAVDAGLSPSEKLAKAKDTILSPAYDMLKSGIDSDIENATTELINSLELRRVESDKALGWRLAELQTIIICLLIIVLAAAIIVYVLLLRPISLFSQKIREDKALEVSGCRELRSLAESYNIMYRENHARAARLRHIAEHDSLTGLRNRGAYDVLLFEHAGARMALMIIDIDHFKKFNDSYGHEMGDKVLQKVANSIGGSVRSTDFPCRIGGDEFAVIMTDVDESLAPVIVRRIKSMREQLLDGGDGLPEITLSVGVAFGSGSLDAQEVFRRADEALYLVKDHGRDGYAFFGDVEKNSR